MKFILFVFAILICGLIKAQESDVTQLMETVRSYQKQMDYDNAILVLSAAEKQSPDNLEIVKQLAYTYYLQGEYGKAFIEISKVVNNENADEQVFQIAGTVNKAQQNYKESEKIYKKGIKKFPHSGILYSEYGEVLYAMSASSDQCIKIWENGIEIDPNCSGNYYNASRYYGTIGNNIWSLLYGEIFVNLESYTIRTIEVKNMLFDIYKQWFISDNISATTPFEQQFVATLNKQSKDAQHGITPEALSVIRTKFILEWFNSSANRPAFRLFEHQRQLLQEGIFEAYNQWLFGSVNNTANYQIWVNNHFTENTEFINFQQGRIFKLPEGQHFKKF